MWDSCRQVNYLTSFDSINFVAYHFITETFNNDHKLFLRMCM